jgi:four helix bundle protein
MKTAETFADLIVWQKSHRLVLAVYQMTSIFPAREIYGLSAQLRRSAVSVPANIAEGFKKRGRGDKLRYLNIAQGSLEETRYYLVLAKDLGYVDGDNVPNVRDVSQLLHNYVRAIQDSAV